MEIEKNPLWVLHKPMYLRDSSLVACARGAGRDAGPLGGRRFSLGKLHFRALSKAQMEATGLFAILTLQIHGMTLLGAISGGRSAH